MGCLAWRGLVEPFQGCIAPTVDDTIGAVSEVLTIHYAGFTYISPRSSSLLLLQWQVFVLVEPADDAVSRFLRLMQLLKLFALSQLLPSYVFYSVSGLCVCMLIWLQCTERGPSCWQAMPMPKSPQWIMMDGVMKARTVAGLCGRIRVRVRVVRVGHVYLWSTYT